MTRVMIEKPESFNKLTTRQRLLQCESEESRKICLFIYNPKDNGENFAEKWNKPLKGQRYSQAFQEWHLSARESVSLGLENFESAESFAKAVKENFGMGGTFISDVNNEIPANWSMPGRPAGTTRNSLAMGSLFGGLVAGATSQEDIKPVERLG